MATTVTLKPNAIDISGSTSGTTTLQATAVAGTTTITLPAATDTLVGKATTDTLTNKTLTTPTISSLSSASATALTLQSAGTTAITVDTSQNVGIGTTSIATIDATSKTLEIYGGAGGGFVHMTNSTTGQTVSDGFIIGTSIGGSDALLIQRESANMIFRTADTERIRIDSSGNVGIGTSSPASKLDVLAANVVLGSNGIVKVGADSSGADVGGQISFTNTNARRAAIAGRQESTDATAGYLQFGTRGSSGDITERMRIDSSGNLLVGTTLFDTASNSSNPSTGAGLGLVGLTSGSVLNLKLAGTNGTIVNFARGGIGVVGTISVTTTATAYNTSSDYRLKEAIAPMTNALAKVALLKPCTYKWKADGSDGQGFIAHELQAVVPDCVTGDKDGLDDDGNPKYQGVDTSFLVATLTAAIQELKAINDTQAETINALTARIVALESK